MKRQLVIIITSVCCLKKQQQYSILYECFDYLFYAYTNDLYFSDCKRFREQKRWSNFLQRYFMLDFHLLKSSIDWKCWSVYWMTSCEDVTRIAAPGTWTILLLNRTCFPPIWLTQRALSQASSAGDMRIQRRHFSSSWKRASEVLYQIWMTIAKRNRGSPRGASVFSRRRAHPFPFLVGAIPTHDQCKTRTGGQNHWILCRGRPPTGFEIVSFICPMSVVFVLVMASQVKQF